MENIHNIFAKDSKGISIVGNQSTFFGGTLSLVMVSKKAQTLGDVILYLHNTTEYSSYKITDRRDMLFIIRLLSFKTIKNHDL